MGSNADWTQSLSVPMLSITDVEYLPILTAHKHGCMPCFAVQERQHGHSTAFYCTDGQKVYKQSCAGYSFEKATLEPLRKTESF